jgi:hypothetical protein
VAFISGVNCTEENPYLNVCGNNVLEAEVGEEFPVRLASTCRRNDFERRPTERLVRSTSPEPRGLPLSRSAVRWTLRHHPVDRRSKARYR